MTSLKILIVEDETIIALDLDDIVRGAGHTVVGIAPSMAAAMKLGGRFKPQAAIVDIGLHGENHGLEVAQALKIPVLFLTGDPGFLVRAMALDIEPLGYIAKPYQPADILAALDQIS